MDRKELHNAFLLAINKEQRSYETYKELAEAAEDPELKDLFEELAQDELEHKKLLEQRYAFIAGEKFGKFVSEEE